MDPRFRFDDTTEFAETLADDVMSRVRVAVPVKITEDSDGHTVKLQPLIKAVQRGVDGKSNEITAVPKLLDQLVLANSIVTLDAMGVRPRLPSGSWRAGAIIC